MSTVRSFPPLIAPGARLLILGSMPGLASLRAGQYYAHPHNAFWPIMGAILDFDPALPYAARCARLTAAGIAVWDVLQQCERPGSLDADIAPHSIIANDFARFLAANSGICQVFFNGAAAESAWRRQVLPTLAGRGPASQRLPSTSPAHASLRPAAKLAVWQAAIRSAAAGFPCFPGEFG